MREIENTPVNETEVMRQLREAQSRKRDRRTLSKPTQPDRDSPEHYLKLVKYYLNRRSAHEGFWRKVEANYCQRHIQEGNFSHDALYEELEDVRPGRIYSYVHTVESMVYNRNPKMFLRGQTPRVTQQTRPVMEAALNAEWWEDRRLVRETRLATRDCTKFGLGVCMTTYEPDPSLPTREDELSVTMREARAADPIGYQLANEAENAASDAESELPSGRESGTYELDDRVIRGKVVTRYIPTWQFMCDPDASCLEDARWVGRMILADYWAVKDDPTLEDVDDLFPASGKDLRDWLDVSEDSDNPYERVILYEIWERQSNGDWRMVVVAPGCSKILREEIEPYWVGQPYSMLRWNEDGKEIFAQSDLLNLWTVFVSEVLLGTKVVQAYAREAMDTLFYDKSGGEFEFGGITDPDIGKLVGVEGDPTRPLQARFYKPPKDPKSPEALNLLAMLERAFQVASGMGPNQFGQALKSETSASEANEIAQMARARGGHKNAAMQDFVSDIAMKRLGMMAQFYTRAQVKRIVGKEMGSQWPLDWQQSDVKDGMNVVVHPGSMAPESDAVRVQQGMAVMQLIAQQPVLASMLNMPALMKKVLHAMGFSEGDGVLLTEDAAAVAQSMAAFGAMQSGAFSGGMGQQKGQASQPAPPKAAASPGQAAQQRMA
jgi:hypothetical protein